MDKRPSSFGAPTSEHHPRGNQEEVDGMTAAIDVSSHADCRFPSCEQVAVTPGGMCEVHRLVVVSSTGSWLEAG
ncbi:hypothetical protein GCM10022242_26800 [Nocardioides panacisoli]|uniref:Uncharacterized protein n=1 Tax=Nocardioides panacisoli TaxID=627624 RepID=A0ABP7IQC6_9ACTN